MKHIADILYESNASIFYHAHEKGAAEWKTFAIVSGDRVDLYAVAKPRERDMVRIRHQRLVPNFGH